MVRTNCSSNQRNLLTAGDAFHFNLIHFDAISNFTSGLPLKNKYVYKTEIDLNPLKMFLAICVFTSTLTTRNFPQDLWCSLNETTEITKTFSDKF